MNKLILIMILFCFTQCSIGIDKSMDLISEREEIILNEFQKIRNKHKAITEGISERGKSILLCLTFVKTEDSTVFKNETVGFYQTANSTIIGMNKPSEIEVLKTKGLALTDNKGRILVETTINNNNSFIFMEIFETNPKSGTINFKQYLTQRGIDFTLKSDEHFLGNIKKTKEGKLVCFITIKVAE